ncbi:MAG: sel1 repeat family protein [archaeon]|nr:sel1 repeat family protein [archaeon]
MKMPRNLKMETFDSRNEEDLRKVRELLEKNDSPMMHKTLGMMLYMSEDPRNVEEAIGHLEIAAEAGDGEAMGFLGDAYFKGVGVEKDEERGMDYFLDGALEGNVECMFNAGNEYMKGDCVPADHAKAFDYLSMAAEGGSERAMNSLGIMYMCGYHVERNIKKAKRLFQKALSRGNENAKINLDLLKEFGPDFDYRILVGF